MTLEDKIKDTISQKLEDGTIEKLVSEHFEKGINDALSTLFRSYGDISGMIQEKIKSVMVPYLENYDYSSYITKLDDVLVQILKESTVENRELLENFKTLMSSERVDKIKASDLFEKYSGYVSKNVDTYNLEIDYDDEPTYEAVEISMNIEESEERSWSCYSYALINLECQHDESVNFQIPIRKWMKSSSEEWTIDYKSTLNIESLRHLNDFELLLMTLTQANTKIILDEKWIEDAVTPEDLPEPTYS